MMTLYARLLNSASDVQQLTTARATEKTTTATTVMTSIELPTNQSINQSEFIFKWYTFMLLNKLID